MNYPASFRIPALVLGLTVVLALPGRAIAESTSQETASAPAATGQLVPATDRDAAWVAHAKTEYPTDACLVSGDKLGADMGKPADFIYREEGKPDRLISFCCKDCSEDFRENPAKYLKVLDDAAAASKKPAAPAQPRT